MISGSFINSDFKECLMTLIWKILVPASLGLALATSVFAQAAGEPGSGGKGHAGMRMGPNNTTGWTHMTKQERMEHQEKMRSMQSHDECTAYVEQHHAMMVERAKEKGRSMPAKPRQDPCAAMKK
jgi:hypothetical protein